ncbi:unnamed protein product, partial [Amoebophrya sp. A25]
SIDQQSSRREQGLILDAKKTSSLAPSGSSAGASSSTSSRLPLRKQQEQRVETQSQLHQLPDVDEKFGDSDIIAQLEEDERADLSEAFERMNLQCHSPIPGDDKEWDHGKIVTSTTASSSANIIANTPSSTLPSSPAPALAQSSTQSACAPAEEGLDEIAPGQQLAFPWCLLVPEGERGVRVNDSSRAPADEASSSLDDELDFVVPSVADNDLRPTATADNDLRRTPSRTDMIREQPRRRGGSSRLGQRFSSRANEVLRCAQAVGER